MLKRRPELLNFHIAPVAGTSHTGYMLEADRMAPITAWGSWSFNPSALTLDLTHAGLPAYSIDLRSITSSACMLDRIFDLKTRPWASNDVMGDLITALQDLFDPRVTLCGGGQDRTLDPLSHFQTPTPRIQ